MYDVYDNPCLLKKGEPPHDKPNEMTCAPSEDLDQTDPPSLIRVFALRFMGR